MATFRVKMDGNNVESMEELSLAEQRKVVGKKRRPVTLELSKTMLNELKRYAGIKNDVSDRAIVLATLTKALGNAKI